MTTNRLDWTIYRKGRWIGIHNETQQILWLR